MSTPAGSPRAIAVEALVRIDDGAYSHILLPELLRRQQLEPRDRAFVTELVYGTVRMRRALDFLLGRFSSRKIESLDPDVRAGLRLGAFQLVTGVSPHAAVGETVGVVSRAGARLRQRCAARARACRTAVAAAGGRRRASIGIRTSHPDWIVQQFIEDLGRGRRARRRSRSTTSRRS